MIVLGIDASLTRTGFAVIEDKILVNVSYTRFKGLSRKSQKRNALRLLVQMLVKKYHPDMIITEKTRLFSHRFVSRKTIIELGALTKFIVDAVEDEHFVDGYGKMVPVFTVNTVSWKSKVIGSRSASKDDAVDFINELILSQGYKKPHADMFDIISIEDFKRVNHDEADACCIALYAFAPKASLEREQ